MTRQAAFPDSATTWLHPGYPAPSPADRELAEIDTEVPALAGPAQCQRHVALGHHGATRGIGGARVGFADGVGPEDLADVVDARELADTTDRGFPEAEAAAAAAQVHLHVLSVAATHLAGSVCLLVERRPAVDLESHPAGDFVGGLRVAGVQQRSTGELRSEREGTCGWHGNSPLDRREWRMRILARRAAAVM